MIVCDEEADAVVRMFRWAAADVRPAVIAAYANALRWTTGAGNRWTARQVLTILRNPVYAGLVVTKSGLGKGCHTPLVDRDLYDAAQSLIEARRTGAIGRRVPDSGITWILQGVLHCGNCGRPMSTHTVRTGPCIRAYYRCRSTAGGREAKGVMIPAHIIETAVLSKIGVDAKRIAKEQQSAVRKAIRAAIYDAASGNVNIELVALHGGNMKQGDTE